MRRQIMASKSHISLVKELNSINHSVDLLITTYKLNENDDNNLLSFYQKRTNLITSKFYTHRFPSEIDLFNNIFETVSEKITEDEYDYVLFVRIDLYLKNLFLKRINDYPKKIMFAHIDSVTDLDTYGDVNIFNICQQIFSIPKKHFSLITNKVLHNHHPHTFKDIITSSGIDRDEISYLTPTLHVCSTDFGWNPYYIQVGREYSREYHTGCKFSNSVEYYYDNIEHKFVHDLSSTIEMWTDYLNTDSLEENLELTEFSFNEVIN
jgi:hypothetical protein